MLFVYLIYLCFVLGNQLHHVKIRSVSTQFITIVFWKQIFSREKYLENQKLFNVKLDLYLLNKYNKAWNAVFILKLFMVNLWE